MNLLDTVGRTEGLQPKLLNGWTKHSPALPACDRRRRRLRTSDPEDVGRLIVSMYVGLRQTSDLDEPERFLDLEKCWALILTGILQPDRIDFFRQFVGRRTALAIRASSVAVPLD